jgi:ankyrin repeat protein
MKKSILTLGIALLLFSNAAHASNTSALLSSTTFVGNYNNATPLASAIANGDVAFVKAFITYGANVNEISNDMTPLMVAARYNQVEIIKLLLDKGANKEFKNSKGFNALRYAELSNAKEATAALKL